MSIRIILVSFFLMVAIVGIALIGQDEDPCQKGTMTVNGKQYAITDCVEVPGR